MPVTQNHAKLQPVGHAAIANKEAVDMHRAYATPHKRHLDFALDDQQLASFEENGFIVLPGLLADEIEDIRDACYGLREREDLFEANNLRLDLADDGKPWKIDPFHSLDLRLEALVRNRKICDGLASIYEGREPRLFKDKLIMKPPGGHGNGLHQDYNWWQGFPTSLISVMVAIDPADKENGCTELFPRRENKFLTEPGVFGELQHDQIDTSGHVYVETQPGDVAFFHCFTPHQASQNNSNRWRSQIFLTYNDSGDGEHYQAHYDHYRWYITRWREQEDQDKAFFM